MIIAAFSLIPGKSIVNTDVPATNADATYTVNAMRNIIAHTTCRVFFSLANLLVRYCGTVIESPAACENFLSLFAQNIQLAAVPKTRPMPIHICPKPNASIDPGSPMRSHADISDA